MVTGRGHTYCFSESLALRFVNVRIFLVRSKDAAVKDNDYVKTTTLAEQLLQLQKGQQDVQMSKPQQELCDG